MFTKLESCWKFHWFCITIKGHFNQNLFKQLHLVEQMTLRGSNLSKLEITLFLVYFCTFFSPKRTSMDCKRALVSNESV